MTALNESTVELAALEYLRELGYSTAYLYDRLRAAAEVINPDASASMLDEAIKRLERAESQNPVAENLRVHQLLTQGVPVEHRGSDGAVSVQR